jgi:hypothetical protein
MTDNTREQAGEHPRTWRWNEDGSAVAGTFVRLDEASTEYGQKAILVLDVDGVERSVWLFEAAVASKLREALEKRSSGDFTVGERIEIHRGAEKIESGNGRKYWPFKVIFKDEPRRSAAEILGLTSKPDAEPELSAEPSPVSAIGNDDDLPY